MAIWDLLVLMFTPNNMRLAFKRKLAIRKQLEDEINLEASADTNRPIQGSIEQPLLMSVDSIATYKKGAMFSIVRHKKLSIENEDSFKMGKKKKKKKRKT